MGFAAVARHTNAGIAARQRLLIPDRIEDREKLHNCILAQREAARVKALAEAIERNAARDRDREQRIAKWFELATMAYDRHRLTNRARAIIDDIAYEHGVRPEDVVGIRRTVKFTLARQHAIYEIARQCPEISTPRIAKHFDRDHTTVIHSIRVWPGKAAKLGISCIPIIKDPA